MEKKECSYNVGALMVGMQIGTATLYQEEPYQGFLKH